MSLVKNFSCKSYCIHGGNIMVNQETPATNWDMFTQANIKAGLIGTGYKVETYKNGNGLKKTVVNKSN